MQEIRDHPDDDNLRLVFSDFLDEYGQGRRAAFIRAQIGFARRASDGCGWHYPHMKCGPGDRLGEFLKVQPWERLVDIESKSGGNLYVSNGGPTGVLFHRGFPTVLCCTLLEFCFNWSRISKWPITHVVIQKASLRRKIRAWYESGVTDYRIKGTGYKIRIEDKSGMAIFISEGNVYRGAALAILEKNFPAQRFTLEHTRLQWKLWPRTDTTFPDPFPKELLHDDS